jgi:hypothetical protein
MKSILYEGVNDPSIRTGILQSNGFCNAHAYQLLALGDPLGHAILYSDLIDQVSKEMSEKSERYRVRNAKGLCMFCSSVNQGESIYINHYTKSLSDQEFFERFQTQGLLCQLHYQAVVDNLTDQGISDAFRTSTVQRYQQLLKSLNEINAKMIIGLATKSGVQNQRMRGKKLSRQSMDIQG